MSGKQTFIDPKTGQEIESTWLARKFCVLAYGLFFGVVGGLASGVHFGFFVGLVCGLVFVLFGVLFYALIVPEMIETRNDRFIRWAHDLISRVQHRRRQRVLRSQERHDIPNTAISRAQPPGKPVPTDTALSLADEPDEPSHLTVSEDTAETMVDDSP